MRDRAQCRLSADGTFPNGVSPRAVVAFIRDHDEAARLEDVADYFGLTVVDVVAALAHEGDRVGAGGLGSRGAE